MYTFTQLNQLKHEVKLMSYQSDYLLLDIQNVFDVRTREIVLIYVSRFRSMKLVHGRKGVSPYPTF